VTLPVRVRRRAELDLDDAYAWYESRAEGLGDASFAPWLHAWRGSLVGPRPTLFSTTGCAARAFAASLTASST
jgi:hypothetical protein